MYRNFPLFNLLLFVLMLHGISINCTDIGSDTAVTLFNNQVGLVNADRIAGFAAINGGFFLDTTSSTTVLFDSFFPVVGNIQLNGGTLNLNQDLVFQDVTNLISFGTINANLHQLEFASGMNIVPSGNAQTGCLITSTTNTVSSTQVN